MSIERPMFPPHSDSHPKMTIDDLLAAARRNTTGPMDPDGLSPSNLSEFLRFALALLLEDIDYEADKASGAAVAARTLAVIINGADEMASKAMQ
jgi:hypothetical protein